MRKTPLGAERYGWRGVQNCCGQELGRERVRKRRFAVGVGKACICCGELMRPLVDFSGPFIR